MGFSLSTSFKPTTKQGRPPAYSARTAERPAGFAPQPNKSHFNDLRLYVTPRASLPLYSETHRHNPMGIEAPMHSSLTRKITHVLIGTMIVAASIVVAAIVWMSVEHDRQAAASSRTMVEGGVAGIGETLDTIAIDYAWWQDAWDNVRAMNDDWVQSNMGAGVTESSTMDLLLIVQPDKTIRYGWDTNSGDTPDPTVLPRDVIEQMVEKIDLIPIDDVTPVNMTTRVGDSVYVLSAARISPEELSGIATSAFPIGIFGFVLSDERIAELGRKFLIADLTLAPYRTSQKATNVLRADNGTPLAQLEWTPYQPGDRLLQQAAIPVAAALALFALAGWAAARSARRSANALADKEEEASRAARHDVLTGLPNRLLFSEKLNDPLIGETCARGECAALFIDLDGFKNVNDTIGHAGGDDLIKAFANKLQAVLPPDSFAARVGGDEFNILIASPEPRQAAEDLAAAIIHALKTDFQVNGKSFRISASIGYAVSRDGSASPAEIVRHADVAMYEAKRRQSGEPVLYTPDYESDLYKNHKIEEALRHALSAGELEVHYQPIVAAGTAEMKAVEALARWNSSDFGAVSPAIFIPIAEQTGLIVELSQFIFRRVFADLAAIPDLRVSVNVSPVQLRDPMFVDTLVAMTSDAKIPLERICLELTEGILVTHPELARQKLLALKKAGFTVALDDFGTGFSSIGYLRQLPIDTLKIDRSFISEMTRSPQAASLVHSIIALGKALDLSVVAEGVETADEHQLLRLTGCDYLQGYAFGKPMPIGELRDRYKLGAQPTRQTA
ncbi:putative bifunctional diguanylate cyclase/phosphodiesterase [Aurantimonas sp. A3-2-R12]|uniref:putative bifunctional diguanylate cyclase/phosphodiesterase n=1 Tax=Aurantimonas sp. A3-2-R12 TaxID=3114362 RepID=UPI002E19CE3F|nr:bifunctional diguanylate cyclase/phosphodiesterase [Aurantimonas sp. A3-2-R12]